MKLAIFLIGWPIVGVLAVSAYSGNWDGVIVVATILGFVSVVIGIMELQRRINL